MKNLMIVFMIVGIYANAGFTTQPRRSILKPKSPEVVHQKSYTMDDDTLYIIVAAYDQDFARDLGRKLMGKLFINNGVVTEDGVWKYGEKPTIIKEQCVISSVESGCFKYTLYVRFKPLRKKSAWYWCLLITTICVSGFVL